MFCLHNFFVWHRQPLHFARNQHTRNTFSVREVAAKRLGAVRGDNLKGTVPPHGLRLRTTVPRSEMQLKNTWRSQHLRQQNVKCKYCSVSRNALNVGRRNRAPLTGESGGVIMLDRVGGVMKKSRVDVAERTS